MKWTFAASLGASLLLAACTDNAQADRNREIAAEKAQDAVDRAAAAAAPIELVAIGEGELPALEGELGCSFTIEGQAGPALVAKANVGSDATAFGAFKIDGRIERVAAPGGFAKLEKGMELTGRRMRLKVERLADQSATDGSEQASYPARLVVTRIYGGEGSFDGIWTCGP